MNKRDLPLTTGFSQEVIGRITMITELQDIELAQMVMAPAYRQNEDGTIELLEFSLIPAANAVGLINRGMDKANEN